MRRKDERRKKKNGCRMPSQIEQREGRIERQGNQHDEIDIFAYATEG